MNFSKCTINGKKYGEYGGILKGGSPTISLYLGDLPEDDKSTEEVGLSLSVNNDDNSEEVSKEKSGGVMLEPVSGTPHQ